MGGQTESCVSQIHASRIKSEISRWLAMLAKRWKSCVWIWAEPITNLRKWLAKSLTQGENCVDLRVRLARGLESSFQLTVTVVIFLQNWSQETSIHGRLGGTGLWSKNQHAPASRPRHRTDVWCPHWPRGPGLRKCFFISLLGHILKKKRCRFYPNITLFIAVDAVSLVF